MVPTRIARRLDYPCFVSNCIKVGCLGRPFLLFDGSWLANLLVMETDKLLRRSFLCAELDANELESIAEIVSIRNVTRGEAVFFQGDPATGFYILLSGSIRIYKASPDGKEYTLHNIRPGQMFAEAAIFGSEQFPANCMALEESVIAFFPKEKFIRLIAESPQISLKMISALSGFVREFNQQIEDLSLKEVSSRIAAYLLRKSEESKNDTIILRSSKSELANSLGTISETLSRNLKKLRELDIVKVDGKKIVILDRDRLRKLADGEKI